MNNADTVERPSIEAIRAAFQRVASGDYPHECWQVVRAAIIELADLRAALSEARSGATAPDDVRERLTQRFLKHFSNDYDAAARAVAAIECVDGVVWYEEDGQTPIPCPGCPACQPKEAL